VDKEGNMKILVINSGSSSLKYQLIETNGEKVLAKGLVERIGLKGAVLSHYVDGKDAYKLEEKIPTHDDAVSIVLKLLVDEKYGALKDIKEIDAVGHRVVHGESVYSDSVIITEDVMDIIQEASELAPLHNPANLVGIIACQQVLSVPMVAVFDTAFHQTMPEKAYIYAIPYEYYEKYKIRRYGFHGTSHRFVTMKTAEILGIKQEKINLVTCHLGNGSSFTAIKNGKSIDTSMGFTPLEGMVMGTRSGDLDPSIVNYIEDKENLCCSDMDSILNKKSGLLGLSGVSSDMRDLEVAADEGNHRARVSLDLFSYRAKKYIGSYATAVGPTLDAIVFTAGIGENAPELREEICKNLEIFGAKLDNEKNYAANPCIISTDDSKVKIMVVPTNEELMIALDTERVVNEYLSNK